MNERRELNLALNELFKNRVKNIDDQWRALETIDDLWDNKIYEEYWKAVIAIRDDLLQARSIELLIKHRGVKSLARVIRYIESEKIHHAGILLAATNLAQYTYQLLTDSTDEPNDILFVLTVLKKSLGREESKIVPFLSFLFKELVTLIDADDFESEEYSLIWFLQLLLNYPIHKNHLLEIVSLVLNSKFRDLILDRVELNPELHATILLYRRTKFVRVYVDNHDISGGIVEPSFLRFALRSLYSVHDIVRYNASVVVREAVQKLHVRSLSDGLRLWDGVLWDSSVSYGGRIKGIQSRDEMRRAFRTFLHRLIDDNLLLSMGIEFTELDYSWHFPKKKTAGDLINALKIRKNRRNLPPALKRINLETNRDIIEDLLPVSLNNLEITFLTLLQERVNIAELHEQYVESDGTINPNAIDEIMAYLIKTIPEMEPVIEEAEIEVMNLIEIILHMNLDAVKTLSDSGYLLPLLQSGELDLQAMIENSLQGSDILDVFPLFVEDKEIKDAIFLLLLYIFHMRAIRQETNKKVLEVITRNTLVDPFWSHLPIELLPTLLLSLIDALSNPDFHPLEGRLLRFFFRMTERVPEEKRTELYFNKVIRYLKNVSHKPIIGAIQIYFADYLDLPPDQYTGPIVFKEDILRKYVVQCLIRLLAKGYDSVDEYLVVILQKNEGLVEDMFEILKEHASDIRGETRAFLESYPSPSVRLLFKA